MGIFIEFRVWLWQASLCFAQQVVLGIPCHLSDKAALRLTEYQQKGTVFEAGMEQASCCYTSHIGGIGFCRNADHSCGIVAQSGN